MIDFEFYETPKAFTRWLFHRVDIAGRVFEPCVGSGAISTCAPLLSGQHGGNRRTWVTNDLDQTWPAHYHFDAAGRSNRCWEVDVIGSIDWTVTNPPFTPAIEIIENALGLSSVGVAMHLRASIHEVLKTGIRRTWMAQHTPTGILWLPRFAYQRSKTTGLWTTDSVCACWVIWLKDPAAPQFIDYATEWVIDELKRDEPAYRLRMDQIMSERKVA